MRELLKNSRNEGMYTPPSLKGTIQMPGHNGGANWGSSAINPQRGHVLRRLERTAVFHASLCTGNSPGRRGGAAAAVAPAPAGAEVAVVRAAPPEAARAARPRHRRDSRRASRICSVHLAVDFFNNYANGLSAIGPPWSQLTAYDLNTGKIIWQVPDGEMPGLPGGKTEQGSFAPRGGVAATGGGLLFVGTSSDRKLRAYDQDTGKVLWSMDVGAAVEGVPTVYEVGGREYVVFCVGGGVGLFAPRGVGITADPARRNTSRWRYRSDKQKAEGRGHRD